MGRKLQCTALAKLQPGLKQLGTYSKWSVPVMDAGACRCDGVASQVERMLPGCMSRQQTCWKVHSGLRRTCDVVPKPDEHKAVERLQVRLVLRISAAWNLVVDVRQERVEAEVVLHHPSLH